MAVQSALEPSDSIETVIVATECLFTPPDSFSHSSGRSSLIRLSHTNQGWTSRRRRGWAPAPCELMASASENKSLGGCCEERQEKMKRQGPISETADTVGRNGHSCRSSDLAS